MLVVATLVVLCLFIVTASVMTEEPPDSDPPVLHLGY